MPASRPSAVTIGAYDGVHTGHRRLIDHVIGLGRAEDLRSVVLTFDRHPAAVVRPESAPKLLCDLDQKLELLRATGVDEVAVVGFDEERAGEPAEDFVEEVLVRWLGARVVVVGRDFHFGKDRGGNVALLESMGEAAGFRVEPFALVAGEDDEVVSSTRIRQLIAAGDLDAAARLLGRPHEVRGVAIEASADGIAVGVPDEILLPPPGRYRVHAGCEQLSPGEADVPLPSGLVVLGGRAEAIEAGKQVRVVFDGSA